LVGYGGERDAGVVGLVEGYCRVGVLGADFAVGGGHVALGCGWYGTGNEFLDESPLVWREDGYGRQVT